MDKMVIAIEDLEKEGFKICTGTFPISDILQVASCYITPDVTEARIYRANMLSYRNEGHEDNNKYMLLVRKQPD